MLKNKKNIKKMGEMLKKLRKSRGFCAVSVAMAAGITRQQLSEYETGKRCMNVEKLIKLIDVLFLTADEARELYECFEAARAEAYMNFSKAALIREESKRKNA